LTGLQSFIDQHGERMDVAEGRHLFRQGDRDPRLFLITSGLLKAYYVRPDGREHIKSFVPKGAIIGSMVAMDGDGSCTFSLVALTASATISLPFALLERAAQADPALANAVIGFLSAYARRKEQREYELLCLSAEARYRAALAALGEITDEISQADLAAYIGITAPALSRLKRRTMPRSLARR